MVHPFKLATKNVFTGLICQSLTPSAKASYSFVLDFHFGKAKKVFEKPRVNKMKKVK